MKSIKLATLVVCGLLFTGCTSIHDLAREGDVSAVQSFIRSGNNINEKDSRGNSPLHYAVEKGHHETVALIARNGGNLDIQNARGATPLDLAFKNADRDIFLLLLNKGAQLSNCDVYVFQAVRDNDLVMVKTLLEHGCDPNLTNAAGERPALVACEAGYKAIVNLLLDRGASATVTDGNGDTLLHKAAMKGNLEVTTKLIRKGADVNALNNLSFSPLVYAVKNGHDVVVDHLLQAGASVTKTKDGIDNPLYYAVKRDKAALVPRLVSRGADPNDNVDFIPLLHIAYNSQAYESAKALIASGADINVKDKWGRSVLHSAVMKDNRVFAAYLIESGADVDVGDSRKQTPLHYICNSPAPTFSLFKMLFEAGGSLKKRSLDGATPLELAMSYQGMKYILDPIEKVSFSNHSEFSSLEQFLAWCIDTEFGDRGKVLKKGGDAHALWRAAHRTGKTPIYKRIEGRVSVELADYRGDYRKLLSRAQPRDYRFLADLHKRRRGIAALNDFVMTIARYEREAQAMSQSSLNAYNDKKAVFDGLVNNVKDMKTELQNNDPLYTKIVYHDCSKCLGSGSIKCNVCLGVGHLTCRNCSGQGRLACVHCKGEGSTLCSQCRGAGSYKHDLCDGRGWRPHSVCNGKGFISCVRCKGRGKETIIKKSTDPVTKKVTEEKIIITCNLCNGSKQTPCLKCKSSGRIRCRECRSTGVITCAKCRGVGRFECVYCASRKFVACNECMEQGHVVCRKCRGNRVLSCSTCDGKGRIPKKGYNEHGFALIQKIKAVEQRAVSQEEQVDLARSAYGVLKKRRDRYHSLNRYFK